MDHFNVMNNLNHCAEVASWLVFELFFYITLGISVVATTFVIMWITQLPLGIHLKEDMPYKDKTERDYENF